MAEESGGDGLGFGDLSPLMTAIVNQDIDSVEHLARAGADLEDGDVLLSAADDITVLQALIDGGVDINTPNGGGLTTLMVAAIRGEEKKIDNLISSCANLNTTNREGATALMLSAVYGHSSIVLRLLDAGADPNPGVQGFTPLMTAIASNDLDLVCVERLLEAGADVNARSQEGDTALCLACRKGLTFCVQVLVNAGADMNLLDSDQNTPLMLAAVSGHTQIVDFLCKRGADLDVTNGNGATALMLSAIRGYALVFLRLVQAGADPNLLGVQGFTPFMVIILSNDLDMICVERLLEAGSDVNARSQEGSTALCLACREGLTFCSNILVNAGADVNLTDFNQNTPLMLAIESGHKQIADFLCRSGAALDVTNGQGDTSLCLASTRGQLFCVQALVNAGADINLPDLNQITPLMWAATQGHDQVVDFLCQAVADVDRTNFDGETALMFAANNGHDGCVRILINAKAQVDKQSDHHKTALMFAANNGHEDCLRILIDAKARTDLLDNNEATALILAAIEGHRNCCEILISAGAADINQADETGMTPLMHAAKENKTGCLELLITSEAEINRADENGWTALMWARAESCLKVLLGCNLDTADKTGATALIHNARSGNVQCLQTLISAGAKLDLSDRDGVTALLAAAQFGQEECLTVLVNKDPSFYRHADVSGKTAMIKCAEMGHERCLKILLSACDKLKTEIKITKENSPQSANVQTALNVCDVTGTTALVYAIQNKHLDCVKLLIESGADVNKKDKHGCTAPMNAAKIGCQKCLNVLINAGADINSMDKKGNTALMWSVIEKHPECLAKLSRCSDFLADQENIDGMTPVMWAAQNGDTQCLQILLQSQADVRKKDKKGQTALLKAAINGGIAAWRVLRKMTQSSQVNDRDTHKSHVECLILILDYMESQGYRPGDKQEELPWAQVAAVTGDKYAEFKNKFLGEYSEMYSELLSERPFQDKDPDYVLMAAAGYSGNVECLKTLLESDGSGINNNDAMKHLSLVWAVIGSQTEAVRFLIPRTQRVTLEGLRNPVDANWQENDEQSDDNEGGCTYCYNMDFLHWQTGLTAAIMCDNAKILQVFIDHKPDIVNYGTSCRKFRLLMFAVEKGKVKCFKCLLDNESDVNVRDHRGETVLNRAIFARDQYARVADFNREVNINVNTALFATNDEWYKCVVSLLERGADVNKVNFVGDSALIYAVKYKQQDCVQLLTDKGADINHENRDTHSALTLAMKNIWLRGFKLLLQKKLDASPIRPKGGRAEDEHCQNQKIYSQEHENDQLNIIQFFIDNVNPNRGLDTKGNTALILAAQWYRQEAVKLLVESGAIVDMQNENGDTALMLARDTETIRYLLGAGEHRSRTHVNKKHDTELTLAFAHSRDSMKTQALLEGADNRAGGSFDRETSMFVEQTTKSLTDYVNHTNKRGETPLTLAILKRYDTEVICLLMKAGANVNYVNITTGETPLTLALRYDYSRGTALGKSTLGILLQSGANVNYIRHDRKTALHLCTPTSPNSCTANPQLVKDLLRNNTVVDVKDSEGKTALMLASRGWDTEYVLALLNAGANIHVTDNEGKTALMLAVEGVTQHPRPGNHEIVDCLLELLVDDADVTVTNTESKAVCAYPGHTECALAFLKAQKDEARAAALDPACAYVGHTECVQALLNAEADVNFKDAKGKTALMLAVVGDTLYLGSGKYKSIECVQKLLNAGAEVNITDNNGKTALMLAAEVVTKCHTSGKIYENTECVQTLLNAGADVNITDTKGKTALLLAAYKGHTACVQALLKAGADVNITDTEGKTALLLAAYKRHTACVQALLKAGADVNITDTKGKTALMLAAYKGRTACVKALLKAGADVNVTDTEGKTALTIADERENHKCKQKMLALSGESFADRVLALLFSEGRTRNDPSAGPAERKKAMGCENSSKNINKGEQKTFRLNKKTWFETYNSSTQKPCVLCCLQLYGMFYGYSQITEICKDHKCSSGVSDNHQLELINSAFGVYDKCLKSFVDVTSELSNAVSGETPMDVEFTTCGTGICESLFSCISTGVIDSWKFINRRIFWEAINRHIKEIALYGHHELCIQLSDAAAKTNDNKDKYRSDGLLHAAVHGHDRCVGLYIEKGCDVDFRGLRDTTPLMCAAMRGHDKCVHLLIKAGCAVDSIDVYARTALMLAATFGHDKCADLLIQAGCKVDCTDTNRMSELMFAAMNGYDKCVDLLIKADCTVDHGRPTPLMYAAMNGRDKCVKILVEAGSDVNADATMGETPLVHAAKMKHKTTAQLLIGFGAHVKHLWKYLFDTYADYELASSCVNFIRNPPKCPEIDDSRLKDVECMREILRENLRLCDFLVVPEASQNHIECLKILKNAGTNINMSECLDEFRTRKLIESDLTTINSLITVGADVNQANDKGMTLLMMFAKENFFLGLNNLFEKYQQVEINIQDNSGFTALTWAVDENAVQCTEILLRCGADVDTVTNDGRTFPMVAATKGHHNCLSLLLQYTRQLDHVLYDGHTALMMAAREGHELCVNLLTENGADKDKTNFSGETALMLAAGEGHVMCVQHLIDNVCDINLRSTKGFTAVIMAARRGQKESLEHLITAHASLDLVDKDGMTALMHAAKEGKRECLNLLTKAGATLDMTDHFRGYTALMFAAEAGQVECLQSLLTANADFNFPNKAGKTAVMVAVESQQGICLYHLLTAGADVTLVDKNKKTAFETAIESDNLELVHIFVIGSANVNFVNKDGLSPLMIALRSDKLRIASYLVSLAFMNMADLKYRPTPEETANMSEEVSEFQKNLYFQPWPLKKLCFILVSTKLGKNPGRREFVEHYLNVEPFRLTFMFRERTDGISNIEWHDLSSVLLPTYRNILQETEARIVDMEVSDAVKDWDENSDDSMREEDEKEKDYEHDKVDGEKKRDDNCNDGYNDGKNINTIVFENLENDEKEGKANGDNESINQSSLTTYPVPTTDRNYHNIIKDDIPLSDNARPWSICTDLRSGNTETSGEHEDSQGFLDGTDSQPSSDNSQLLNQVNIRQCSTQSNTFKDAQKRGLETQIFLNLILLSQHKVATVVNNSRPMLKTGLNTRLEEKNLKLWPVARDGDCLITATLRQDSTFRSVKELRDAICDHMLLHRHHYMQFLSVNDMNQFESKVELLRQPGHWNSDIGDVVPLVISNLLGKKIIIYSNNEHFPEIIITPDLCHVSGDDLHYVYHDSPGHYDNVKPAANFPPL